jgi:hypothetical protein
MTEGRDPERREGGGSEGSGVSDDEPHGGIGGQGGEGEGAAAATPPIGDEGEHGQTQVDRDPDDSKTDGDDADD